MRADLFSVVDNDDKLSNLIEDLVKLERFAQSVAE